MSAVLPENLKQLLLKIEGLTTILATRDEKLQHIANLLAETFDNFDWVGFYRVDPNEEHQLVLGPFVGAPTDHTKIAFGQGICGQAAETRETFVVQDVSKAINYLSCSVDVEAEIVVPIMKEGEFVAELDIDSHQKGSITEEQKIFLEETCNILSKLF